MRSLAVEMVLAQIPEQVWAWDEATDLGVGTVDVTVEVPMARRRAIINEVLTVIVAVDDA